MAAAGTDATRRTHGRPSPAVVSALLERCDGYVRETARMLWNWRLGYAAGRDDGWRDGYAQAEADMAASWHRAMYPAARPEAHRRESAARRLAAAEAGCRRDAADHERAFVARAYATPARMRSEPEQAAVQLYPPPESARPRHLRSVGPVGRG